MIDCGLDWLGKLRTSAPQRDRNDACASGSCLGFEKRCALAGIRAEEDVAKSKELPGRRPTFDKGARGDENLRHYVRGFPGRALAPRPGGRIPRQRGLSVHFLRAGSDFHSRSIDRIEKRARLHWRRRDLHPLVHSQARRKADRACGYQRADRLVPESGRVASHYHSLRLGNCHRRRAQSRREPPRDGRRAWRRNTRRARPDGAGSAIKQIRCENCNDFV
jgi:hypothetical protein